MGNKIKAMLSDLIGFRVVETAQNRTAFYKLIAFDSRSNSISVLIHSLLNKERDCWNSIASNIRILRVFVNTHYNK